MARILIIDCQILQTPAFDRGMGKYTVSLLKELAKIQKKAATYSDTKIVLSKNLDTSKERIAEISNLGFGEPDVIDLPTDLAIDMLQKYDEAESRLTEYVAQYSNSTQVDFLITAPFFANFAATFPANGNVKKMSLVYDLIPHKIWNLLRIFPDDIYFHHYQLFVQADHLFTISNAVKDDLIELLGLPETKITDIDGGPFVRAANDGVSEWHPGHKQYILMPSGPIVHKNNERAVTAFERFNKSHNNEYRLFITSDFDDESQNKLRSISQNITFTGNISDASLGDAYRDASAVLFPSMAEGLGMPVLEAALDGIPVACSDIPVLSELSDDAFYQFNPTEVDSIVASLEQATSKSDWDAKLKAYKILREKYTWERSAKLLNAGLTQVATAKPQSKQTLNLVIPKPNHNSPAAYLGEILYASLVDKFDVTLTFSDEHTTNMPSYVAYIKPHGRQVAGLRLQIKNPTSSKLAFWKSQKSVDLLIEQNDKIDRKTYYAKQIFTDKALQLKGWKFSNNENEDLNPVTLVDSIFSELEEKK